jgi:hydrogenase-4 component E
METVVNTLLLLILLTDLYMLGASRLAGMVRMVAFQGVMLSLLPLFQHGLTFSFHLAILSLIYFIVKGLVMPYFLFRALRNIQTRHEAEPYVGPTASYLIGAGIIGFSFWIASRLPIPPGLELVSRLCVPVALSGVLTGLFILVSRRKAITQILGYLLLEAGIYVLAIALSSKMPFLVEMGILLDVFAGVFIMGVIISHIKSMFDDLDVDHLTTLKD